MPPRIYARLAPRGSSDVVMQSCPGWGRLGMGEAGWVFSSSASNSHTPSHHRSTAPPATTRRLRPLTVRRRVTGIPPFILHLSIVAFQLSYRAQLLLTAVLSLVVGSEGGPCKQKVLSFSETGSRPSY